MYGSNKEIWPLPAFITLSMTLEELHPDKNFMMFFFPTKKIQLKYSKLFTNVKDVRHVNKI